MAFNGNTYYGAKGVRELTKDVLYNGQWQEDGRTGVRSLSMFDAKVVIDEGFPFVKDILASPRLAFEELWFFLRGETDTKILEEKGVRFWKGNTSREFLDNRGLQHLPEGSLGSAYSKQWRDFGSGVKSQTGVDQLSKLLTSLEKDRYSRRHVVTLWNPLEEMDMPITPCWWAFNFVVMKDGNGVDVLHMKSVNRSLDVVFGASFALMQQRLLQMALCKMFDFELGVLSADLSNVHIYENQVSYALELVTRLESGGDCSIELTKKPTCLESFVGLQWEDWDMSYSYNKEWMREERPEMVA